MTDIRDHRNQPPRLADFKHDMNEHNARYGRVTDGDRAFVLELENQNRPTGHFRLLVWEAVRAYGPHKYERPDVDGNRYAWDAVGEQKFRTVEDSGEAQRTFRRLKDGDVSVPDWVDDHPYTGPRTPRHIRDD
jgi:hypothetical protein